MNVLETMPHNVDVVREWWDNLSEDEKDTTAVYMVIGDMEGKCNCDFLAGRGEDIMYTLAQSMANDRDFYEIAKAAVELVDRYNTSQLEELKSCVGETTSKVVS
jgi:hypothetical protein